MTGSEKPSSLSHFGGDGLVSVDPATRLASAIAIVQGAV